VAVAKRPVDDLSPRRRLSFLRLRQRSAALPLSASDRSLQNAPLPLPEPEPWQPGGWARYTVPPLSLLDAPKAERKVDERELMEGARCSKRNAASLRSKAQWRKSSGPVVTTFEFKPDAGVKYGKITGLADDLCLAMQAESVLIDRIPASRRSAFKSRITRANRSRCAKLLQSECYQRSGSKLTLPSARPFTASPT
jgi:S-DNA-T family DNA segregation ATPase FtsK/SpoIIIE